MQMWQSAKGSSSSVPRKRRAWPPPALKEPADAGRLVPLQWHGPKYRQSYPSLV
jgi:hypothetical protein